MNCGQIDNSKNPKTNKQTELIEKQQIKKEVNLSDYLSEVDNKKRKMIFDKLSEQNPTQLLVFILSSPEIMEPAQNTKVNLEPFRVLAKQFGSVENQGFHISDKINKLSLKFQNNYEKIMILNQKYQNVKKENSKLKETSENGNDGFIRELTTISKQIAKEQNGFVNKNNYKSNPSLFSKQQCPIFEQNNAKMHVEKNPKVLKNKNEPFAFEKTAKTSCDNPIANGRNTIDSLSSRKLNHQTM